MGSGQSARKLTISNEDEVGVIKVSNAIIQRLAQGERTAKSEPAPDIKSIPTSSAVTVVPPQTSSGISGYPVYYPELTMSAHQIQQQKEQELKQQDEYWKRRLRNLEDSYQQITRILEDEYKKTASETLDTKSGKRTTDIQDKVQPCLENSNKVLKCFQDHPKETLKCSNLVEEFSNCVWNVHYPRVIETRS